MPPPDCHSWQPWRRCVVAVVRHCCARCALGGGRATRVGVPVGAAGGGRHGSWRPAGAGGGQPGDCCGGGQRGRGGDDARRRRGGGAGRRTHPRRGASMTQSGGRRNASLPRAGAAAEDACTATTTMDDAVDRRSDGARAFLRTNCRPPHWSPCPGGRRRRGASGAGNGGAGRHPAGRHPKRPVSAPRFWRTDNTHRAWQPHVRGALQSDCDVSAPSRSDWGARKPNIFFQLALTRRDKDFQTGLYHPGRC